MANTTVKAATASAVRSANGRPLTYNVRFNQFSGGRGIRIIRCANSGTRSSDSPARGHTRRKAANGAGRFVFAHEQPTPANPVTAKARPQMQCDHVALRGRFMGKNHDRTLHQAQVELPAGHANHRRPAHALPKLVSTPAPKGVGPSASSQCFQLKHSTSLNTNRLQGTLSDVR